MGKLFGTDGIRGVVGENLTADMAFRVGQAVSTVLMEEKGSRPTVVIGKDTRISSDMLESALMAGICSVGGDVKPVGTIPTPAVAYLARQEKADAGIVISASHNPYEHNGIKVFSGQGYKLSDDVEARIEEKILSGEPMKLRTRGEIGRRHHGMRQLKRDYIDFVASTIESDLAGLHILVDCANGASSATAPELFGRFKAHTDFIHKDPDGVNINNRCGSTHLEDLAASVVKGGYDIGVAFDGDADRCLLVDEKGNTIDGDKVMAVCAMDMKRRGALNGNTIVATVMSNMALEIFMKERGGTLLRTRLHFPRPYEQPGFTPLVAKESRGHSMPSRHALSAAVLAAVWLYFYPAAGCVMVGIALLICCLRVLTGVHHVRDVVCGFALGFALGCAGMWLL